jgi:hypothetical protein
MRSPCRRVRIAQPEPVRHLAISAEQVRSLAVATGTDHAPMVYLAAVLGLRWGECAGLRVGDIDFLGRTVAVESQLPACRAADLKGFQFKMLHTANATAMIALAVDIKTAQARTGHRRATTLLDIYAKPTAPADRSAAEALGTHFFGRRDGAGSSPAPESGEDARAISVRWRSKTGRDGDATSSTERNRDQGSDGGGASWNRTSDLSIISAVGTQHGRVLRPAITQLRRDQTGHDVPLACHSRPRSSSKGRPCGGWIPEQYRAGCDQLRRLNRSGIHGDSILCGEDGVHGTTEGVPGGAA